MNLAFVLTMPNVGSWNGRWSGEGNLYCVIKTFGASKRAKEKYSKLINRSFYYRWDDGWGASVGVKEVGKVEARIMRRNSRGFCGYEWMIDSILERGIILADHQVEEWEKRQVELLAREQALFVVRQRI